MDVGLKLSHNRDNFNHDLPTNTFLQVEFYGRYLCSLGLPRSPAPYASGYKSRSRLNIMCSFAHYIQSDVSSQYTYRHLVRTYQTRADVEVRPYTWKPGEHDIRTYI